MSHKPPRNLLFVLVVIAIAAVACSSSTPVFNDPPGFTCEYEPTGQSGFDFLGTLSPERLGQFDEFLRVRITGHIDGPLPLSPINLATIEEVVQGSSSTGSEVELINYFGLCLESGREYYLLLNEAANGSLVIPHPWAQFPVINNRITLHPEMRKASLIGDFHGLDPILFKRRFVEAVGRTDIDVD